MKSIRSLKKKAMDSCKFRNHDMHPFSSGKAMSGLTYWTSVCRKCQCYVQVCQDPPPNGIDIGGNAVALNCKP